MECSFPQNAFVFKQHKLDIIHLFQNVTTNLFSFTYMICLCNLFIYLYNYTFDGNGYDFPTDTYIYLCL